MCDLYLYSPEVRIERLPENSTENPTENSTENQTGKSAGKSTQNLLASARHAERTPPNSEKFDTLWGTRDAALSDEDRWPAWLVSQVCSERASPLDFVAELLVRCVLFGSFVFIVQSLYMRKH